VDAVLDNISTGLAINLQLSERDRIELKGTILAEDFESEA
jgi:hypothetical protein